jgi:hypothetical protein
MLAANALAIVLLAFAALAGGSAGLAYLLDQRRGMRMWSAALLAASQIAMLGWVLVMIGPRPALLAGVPALFILMARVLGRERSRIHALLLLGLYGLCALLAGTGQLMPLLTIQGSAARWLDAVVVLLGASLSLLVLDGVLVGRERARALAQARAYEARTLRERMVWERTQTEAEADALHTALAAALRRRVVFPITMEGPLSLLATTGNRVLERLAVLHQDREERQHLEDALRRLIRALERSWLGLPQTWPAQTGTAVDEVVALLRAPRPADMPAPSWPDDGPTLISLPSLRSAREQAGVLAAAAAEAATGARPRPQTLRLVETSLPLSGVSSSCWTLHDADDLDEATTGHSAGKQQSS